MAWESALLLKLKIFLGQEDYLKRQFDQLGKVLGRILTNLIALKEVKDAPEIYEITNRALKKEMDLDIDQLLAVPADQFLAMFNNQMGLNPKHLERFGNIFYELADLMDQDGLEGEQKRALYQRTAEIYQYLNETGSVYSLQRQFLISKIRKKLGEN
jgi:hypothetical protein